jgi:hypothetical protein
MISSRRDPWGALVADMPRVEELVRRLSTDHSAVEVEHGPRRTVSSGPAGAVDTSGTVGDRS